MNSTAHKRATNGFSGARRGSQRSKIGGVPPTYRMPGPSARDGSQGGLPKGNNAPQAGSEWGLADQYAREVLDGRWGEYTQGSPVTVYYYDHRDNAAQAYAWVLQTSSACQGIELSDADASALGQKYAHEAGGMTYKNVVLANEYLDYFQELEYLMVVKPYGMTQEDIIALVEARPQPEVWKLKILIHEMLHATSSPPSRWPARLIESVTDYFALMAIEDYVSEHPDKAYWQFSGKLAEYEVDHIKLLSTVLGVDMFATAYFTGNDDELERVFELYFQDDAAYPLWLFMLDRGDIYSALAMLDSSPEQRRRYLAIHSSNGEQQEAARKATAASGCN